MDARLKLDGAAVLGALSELPGGRELLELSRERGDVELVGGAARDLLLGRSPRELDVLVTGDVASLARELATRLRGDRAGAAGAGPETTLHERFGTATVAWASGRIDIAARRSEFYPAPGALPEVRAGTAEEDLARRDFTINAIAIPLSGPDRGVLRTVPNALEDLRESRLRVLHERSFIDDPTRLLRLARYRARLGFELEQRTAELAVQALAQGALTTVSGARLGAELRLALTEPDPVAALSELDRIGALQALNPLLSIDPALARVALAETPPDAGTDVVLLACLILPIARDGGADSKPVIRDLLDALEFGSGERQRALSAASDAAGLLTSLDGAERPSELMGVLSDAPVEAIVLAVALGELQSRTRATAAARRWLHELRHVRLKIGGDDLLAAGVPAGPEIGRRLDAALAMRLDGELDDTPKAQLHAALEGSP